MSKISPLSILPLGTVIRSLVINTISSSPLLLSPSLKIMTILAHSQNPILSPDQTHAEVQSTVRGIKDLGFKGVFLCYAREVEKSPGANIDVETCVKNEVLPWAEGTLATVRLAEPGDFVSIKVTGAGSLALQALEKQGRYNKPGKGGAVIYGTYQAYLKACPQVVAKHMAIARKENFTLGVKLVRGAPTNDDGIAEALNPTILQLGSSTRRWEKEFQAVDLALAGHNLESVRKAQVIRTEQAEKGEDRIELCYAQLQGMADEVSCELVAEGKMAESLQSSNDEKGGGSWGINELIGGTKGGKIPLELKTDVPRAL
ncbi:hypothetical protein DID88_000196 [Monilinia fructigena]|uniref:Proline dehydrogenase n=1 Tax=Monilinia fructigena TaxID=38457 RepID=A0A395IJR6_9HELO|nr:hypothetical protein DID88_000196 [Monilinia fructigena]